MPEEFDNALEPKAAAYAARAANEGIPVSAIGRILHEPFDIVYEALACAKARGDIVEIPRSDWPPTSKLADRLPGSTPRPVSDEDLSFSCHKVFKLTNLEAGFLALLLKSDHCTKVNLHGIVEHQRLTRATRPNSTETTDIKMVDVMICKLRAKLRNIDFALNSAIKTVWGGGYYIEGVTKALILGKLGVQHDERDYTRAVDQASPGPDGNGVGITTPSGVPISAS